MGEPRRVGRPRTQVGERWEDRHRRLTFHCPAELLEAIERESAATGLSKSRVIVERLRAGGLDAAGGGPEGGAERGS